MSITAPKGMRDMLPDEAAYWRNFQNIAFDIFGKYGYVPIEVPIAERTELFVRGIGEATDVVSKEMFNAISDENLNTLLGGGNISANKRLSLRPEGTAGVVRAVVQHDLVPQGAPPVKLMYAGPMFRAEQPQEGRYRQFHQIGVECLGASAATIDAEGIMMAARFFKELGFDESDFVLLINSMGCDNCRPAYRDKVYEYGMSHLDDLCDNCKQRLKSNPLRMFDCKNDTCRKIMQDAPCITDSLCGECNQHYNSVLSMLNNASISYTCDSSLVRGLDYYGRTVFEVQLASKDGAQNALGGGGRYDKLAAEIRQDDKAQANIPGFGFAIGYERCKEALIKKGFSIQNAQKLRVFVACATTDARNYAFNLVQQLRDANIAADLDHQDRSLKSQFKMAGRLGVSQVIIIGTDELEKNLVKIRDMQLHEETLVDASSVIKYFSQLTC